MVSLKISLMSTSYDSFMGVTLRTCSVQTFEEPGQDSLSLLSIIHSFLSYYTTINKYVCGGPEASMSPSLTLQSIPGYKLSWGWEFCTNRFTFEGLKSHSGVLLGCPQWELLQQWLHIKPKI